MYLCIIYLFPKQCLHLMGSYLDFKVSFWVPRNAGRFPNSAQTSLDQPRLQNRYKKVACSKTSVFTMNSITFSKNTSFYNEFYYQKTSVFTVFLKNGPIWDLCFFKNLSFYNEFGIFLSACFKNISFYNEFCMLFAQDETKTYLCSKTSVFYNELCTLFQKHPFLQ